MPGFGCGSHRHYQAGCFRCGVVDSAYNRRRRHGIANGTWQHAVSATDVLAHIERLRTSGMTVVAIARTSGVNVGTLRTMIQGSPRTVTGPVAAAILATPAQPSLKAGHVPAVGSVRRIRAMVANGYSLAYLADRIGKQLTRVCSLAQGRQTSVAEETHRAFSDLYDELVLVPGPSVRARSRARRLGWHPPNAWADIDNPDAKPYAPDTTVDRVRVDRVLDGATVQLTEPERHHAVHLGIARGMTMNLVATRLGMSHARAKTLATKPLPATYELVA